MLGGEAIREGRLHVVERLDEAELELQSALPGEPHGEEREPIAGHVDAGLSAATAIGERDRLKIELVPIPPPQFTEFTPLSHDFAEDVAVLLLEDLGDLPAVRHRHPVLLEDDVGPRARRLGRHRHREYGHRHRPTSGSDRDDFLDLLGDLQGRLRGRPVAQSEHRSALLVGQRGV